MFFLRHGLSYILQVTFLLVAIVLNANVSAQIPSIVSSSPTLNALNVPTNSNISVLFDVDMDPSTINDTTFVVTSKTFGLLSGTISYDGPTKTTIFDPVVDFGVGEIVTVVLTKNVNSLVGNPIDYGKVWTFTVEVQGGTGHLTLVETDDIEAIVNSVFSSDLNIDGNPDLVFSEDLPYNSSINVRLNNGDGTFSTDYSYSTIYSPYVVLSADLDKNNGPDIVAASSAIWGLSIFFNNDNGTFADRVEYPMTNCEGAYIADLNGDSYFDLILANVNLFTVLINNGSGIFTTRYEYATNSYARSVCAVDVDNDRDMDIVVACYIADSFQVFINDGEGHLNLQTSYSTSNGPSYITAVDVDNDNDMDILTAQSAEGDFSIFYNDGNGNYSNPTNISYGESYGSIAIQAADMDADGDQDLIVANMSSRKIYTFFNNGSGSFLYDTFYSAEPMPFTISTSDHDGDGDLDLAVASTNFSSLSSTISIFRNDFLYICGDVNESGKFDIADIVFCVDFLFRGVDDPFDFTKMDVDVSGTINVADIVCLVSYLFRGGPEPICNIPINN
ncbi:MAG: FG-GAP-like repeat-containing protein [bacterium]